MGNELKEKYFVKKSDEGYFEDITDLFDGVRVLKMDGFLSMGKPVNIFTQQWIDEQEEDFMITTIDENDNPKVIRENVDIEMTFIVRQKYAKTPNINVQCVHDCLVEYMTSSDLWLGTNYMGGRCVHCVCLKEYTPTIVKLCRGENSYIMGTLTFHALNAPCC